VPLPFRKDRKGGFGVRVEESFHRYGELRGPAGRFRHVGEVVAKKRT
jgi:hypothetical protein